MAPRHPGHDFGDRLTDRGEDLVDVRLPRRTKLDHTVTEARRREHPVVLAQATERPRAIRASTHEWASVVVRRDEAVSHARFGDEQRGRRGAELLAHLARVDAEVVRLGV